MLRLASLGGGTLRLDPSPTPPPPAQPAPRRMGRCLQPVAAEPAPTVWSHPSSVPGQRQGRTSALSSHSLTCRAGGPFAAPEVRAAAPPDIPGESGGWQRPGLVWTPGKHMGLV